MMKRALLTPAAIVTLALLAAPAVADPSERPPRPYQPVAVELPVASPDPAFEAFRRALAAAAKSRVYAELARLVDSQGFFWGRDFARAFDARKPAVDNLAAAIRLEHADGSGWQTLAAFAAEPTTEPLASRTGVVCAPAPPAYDGTAFARMLDETYGAGLDWTYPRADRTPVRAEPQAGAASVDVLGLHFVRRLGFEGPDGTVAPALHLWARVVTPAGKVGFVAPDSLRSIRSERLCYVRDAVGQWHIAGFISGAN